MWGAVWVGGRRGLDGRGQIPHKVEMGRASDATVELRLPLAVSADLGPAGAKGQQFY
jgi:hypothetical protein